MLKYARHIAVGSLIAFCIPLTPGLTQDRGEAGVSARPDCGGQYECIEVRPLTASEARTSRGYPEARSSEEASKASPDSVADEAAGTTLARRPAGAMREHN